MSSAAELTKVFDNTNTEWRLFIELMALAGLRKTEAIEARVGDIDLDNGQLIVRCGGEGTKWGHHRIEPIHSIRLHETLSVALKIGRRAKPRQLIQHVEPRSAISRAAAKARIEKVVSPPRLRVAGACRRGEAARGVGVDNADGAQHALGHRALHAPRPAQRRGRDALRPAGAGGRALGV